MKIWKLEETLSFINVGPHAINNLTFYSDVLNSKSKNDGPNHTEGHFYITVDNFWKE